MRGEEGETKGIFDKKNQDRREEVLSSSLLLYTTYDMEGFAHAKVYGKLPSKSMKKYKNRCLLTMLSGVGAADKVLKADFDDMISNFIEFK